MYFMLAWLIKLFPGDAKIIYWRKIGPNKLNSYGVKNLKKKYFKRASCQDLLNLLSELFNTCLSSRFAWSAYWISKIRLCITIWIWYSMISHSRNWTLIMPKKLTISLKVKSWTYHNQPRPPYQRIIIIIFLISFRKSTSQLI